MIPRWFEGCVGVMNPPKGWDDEQFGFCDPMPYTREGDQFFVSQWVPDSEELARLNAGLPVLLKVSGPPHEHPVVSVGVAEKQDV